MNKKKIIIILLSISLVAGLGLSAYTVFKIIPNGQTTQSEQKNEEELNKEVSEIFKGVYTEDEIKNMTKEEKDNLLNPVHDNNEQKVDKKKESISDEKVEEVFERLIQLSQKADFTTALNEVSKIKEEYNLDTGASKKLLGVEYDITSIMATNSMDISEKAKMLEGFNTPELLTIGTLLMPEETRRDIIKDNNSLSPIFEGEIIINNVERVTPGNSDDDKVAIMNEVLPLIETVFKIEVTVENNSLIAYVGRSSTQKIHMYGVYTKEGSQNYYQTIDFWNKLDQAGGN